MKAIELQCIVKSFRMLTPTVFELGFEPSPKLEFKAGQFASIIIPGAGPKGRDLRRAYSIASSPDVYPVELCVKVVENGPGTQFLYHLRPGDSFKSLAPYGDFVYRPKIDRYVCFVATGTGIAPFRSMLLSKDFQAQPPLGSFCFFGVRKEEELLYQDLMDQCSNLKLVNAVSQPSAAWKGFKGRVTDYIRKLDLEGDFPWFQTDYYLCGHGGMIHEVKAFLLEKGVEKSAIHQEIYYK